VIAVDTSVWVSALRGGSRDTAGPALRGLLDADEVLLPLPVRIELLAGVARANRAALTRALSALPVAMPTEETWAVVQKWTESAAEAGHRFGLTDLLIGALADELGALVWSLDEDFARLAGLKLVRLYA
jgi:predicted nucleic acid-binding protein